MQEREYAVESKKVGTVAGGCGVHYYSAFFLIHGFVAAQHSAIQVMGVFDHPWFAMDHPLVLPTYLGLAFWKHDASPSLS